MTGSTPLLRPGTGQAVASFATATATAVSITLSATDHRDVAGRLAVSGVILFAFTLAVGSARLVGLATLPVFGAALVAAGGRASVGSIVVGCLWYVALELAWDSIERRDGGERTAAFVHRRVHEVATVVTLALVVTIAGFAATDAAPERSLFTQGPIIVGLLIALGLVTRSFARRRPLPSDL